MFWKRILRPAALAMFTATLVAVAVAATPSANAATIDTVSPADTNIKYFGRWDKTSTSFYGAGWAGAYFRAGFTGTTVKLQQRNAIDLWASIDGEPFVRHNNVSGVVDLTPTPLAAGRHTLAVSYRQVAGNYRGDAVFGGLILDPDATTFTPRTSAKLIEFIGDSITAGATTTNLAMSDYAWLIGEQLGVEHTQVAQGGACLRELTPAESTRGINCVGLQHRFGLVSAADGAASWDFTQYQATAVVINIGTNDVSHGVSREDFQPRYVDLLHQARAKYPLAAIFAMIPFNQRYAAQIRAAATTVNQGGDAGVYLVETAGWITPADRNDSTHPSDSGHQKIAGLLAPVIAAKLGQLPDDMPLDGATQLPAQGELSTTSGWRTGLQDGTYDVNLNLWWGANASTFVLYENGVEIARRDLTPATPDAQAATVAVSGRPNGTYRYTGELRSQAGITITTATTVEVTANPGKPTVSSNNWDGDGTYTVSMDLWWGTNATEYRLYEDGALVDTQQLTAATPQAQTASTALEGRASGSHTYVAELINAAGVTRSDPLVVLVNSP